MLELILIVAFLILLNGFFAMSEMSLMTSRKVRLKQMATTSKRAATALKLAENPDHFLSTVQIGITSMGIVTGLLGGDALGEIIGAELAATLPWLPYAATIGKVIAVALITYVTLIFGELVPKRLALTRSESIATLVAVPMDWLAKGAAPFVWLLSRSTRLVLRVLGLGKDESASVTEEEIRLLVAESHEQGVIDQHERDMMNRVMRLGDRTADSLMTPRNRIAWLDTTATPERNLAMMREHEFSRYPVYRGNDQDIAGILEVKSLITHMDPKAPQLFQHLRETLFVSESTHAMKLLEIFREEQQSMALVVDEYGEIQGLVTISDLMGAVVGRLQAVENADEDALVVTREDGSLLIDGSLSVEELREVLGGAALPDAQEGDYHTLAGLVIFYFGRIPNVGEYFDWAGWRIEVIDLDGARIDKLLLSRLAVEDEGDDTVG
ncbi:hemolysin family protein [Stenotrophomonas panacihumi]|uniref:hemolysin family protein n=1 Tax=Stenotrophomonas panacihumi TaxID=676599 RepID=UPI000D38B6C0|nr:hemolysin family protein [Stenotrophomonas panacihumi]PTN53101.1 hemolysin [Stenotrophomonas panacihumi]